MNITDTLIGFGKEFSKKLQKSAKIDAMQVHGSLMQGFSDNYSDVDTMIYCNSKLTIQEVKKLLKGLEYFEIVCNSNWPIRLDVKYKGVKIMLLFVETKWMMHDLKNYIHILPMDYYMQRSAYVFLGNSKYYFDKLGVFKKSQKEIKKSILEKFKMNSYSLMKDLEYNFFLEKGAINIEILRNNDLFVSNIFSESLVSIYSILFALNNTFLMNKKWVYKYLPNFKVKPKLCLERLVEMAKIGNDKKTIDKKIGLFKEFIIDLKKLLK
ncbi:MAG: hypothetical protein WC376_02320 [Candidatus Nanoarchaeia archaeon]|jgi:predicted nucleotidyltransferase